MIGFYRSYIPNASDLSCKLTDMLKKGVKEPLEWSDDAVTCFKALKQALAKDPVLRVPNADLPFVLRTDASNSGLGAVLLQYIDGVAFPIAYASRKLLPREIRYSVVERECMGILYGIKKFEYYLVGREFILEVDHKPLVYMERFKGSNDKLLRWSQGLQSYKFRIVHISGSDNVGADILSRAGT